MKNSGFSKACRSLLCGVALLGLLSVVPIDTAYADSLREVAERVARQHDAKVVSAREVTDRNGQKIYVIRILTRDGVVRTIRVPARNHDSITQIQNAGISAWRADPLHNLQRSMRMSHRLNSFRVAEGANTGVRV